MKTRNKAVITILFIVLIIGFIWNVFGPFLVNQTLITGYVKNHAEELEQMAQGTMTLERDEFGNSWREEATFRILNREAVPDLVEFDCWGWGLAPSSKYIGFYYSANDIPMAYCGAKYELIEDGDGWSWQEPESDNHGYTEKIMDKWYYYEASF